MFALVNFLLSTLIISWNFNEDFTMNFIRKPINYSTKNIRLTSEKAYKKLLVEKIELLIKRNRWKAFFFDNPRNDEEPVQKYGFKSRSSPAQHKDLIKFEEDLLALAKNVKFSKTTNKFQQNLMKDIKSIKNSEKAYVFADKTRNL